MSSCDPENPYLTSLYSGRPIISPRVSRSTTVTSSIITNSTIQHFPLTSDPANPYLTASDTSQPIASTEPHEDAFAELASYQPIRFEDDQPQFSSDFGGFGNFDSFEEFINTYLPKEPEAQKPITGQPAGQASTASVLNNPVIFSQGGNRPAQDQPKASTETATEKATAQTGHVPSSFLEFIREMQQASRPYDPYAPIMGPAVSGTPVNSVLLVNTGPVYPLIQKMLLTKLPKTASPDGSEA